MTTSNTITAPRTTGDTTGATSVTRLLEAITAGTGVPTDVLAPGIVLDATIPGWRLNLKGAEAVAQKFGVWFADPGIFEEFERFSVDGTEIIVYLLTWVENGVPHAAHHCHVLRFDAEGRIALDQFFCGGRWNAGLLAEMAEANGAL